MKIEYNGQGVGNLLLEMVKQATGVGRIPKSTHNQYVYKTLIDARKDRARIWWITDDYSKYNNQDLTAWYYQVLFFVYVWTEREVDSGWL